jgi:putative MFS transporter
MEISSNKTFEELTESRLGFGRFQYRILCLLGIIFIADGIELSVMSLILPLLKNQWEIDENLQGLLGSVMFLGLMLGSVCSGLWTDKLGRKATLQYLSLLQFFLGIYSSTINSVYLFLFIRGAFGFLLGFQIPLIPTLCAELIPLEKRGRMTVIINGLFSIGQVIAVLIASICLEDLSSGNWRLMLFICSLPPILVYIGCYKYMLESPRLVIIKGNITEGINILNNIQMINNEENDIFQKFNFEKDYEVLERWRETTQENLTDENILTKLYCLFNKTNNNFRITICLWINWFSNNFLAYGLVFILPFFLNALDSSGNKHSSIGNLIITTTGELLGSAIGYFMIDIPMFGRKYSLAIGELISSLCCLLTFFVKTDSLFLITLIFLSRCFAKLCFGIMYPFTAELYSTNIRTLGVGLSSAIGRISACLMPIITIKLFYINIYHPFLIFFFVGVCGFFATLFIPHDTTNKSLDSKINQFEYFGTEINSTQDDKKIELIRKSDFKN